MYRWLREAQIATVDDVRRWPFGPTAPDTVSTRSATPRPLQRSDNLMSDHGHVWEGGEIVEEVLQMATDESSPDTTANDTGKEQGNDSNNSPTKKIQSCPHCKKSFASPNGYAYHVNNKVCQKEEQQSKSCPHCNEVFKTSTGLNYHMSQGVCQKAETSPPPARGHETVEYPCPRCDKKFATKKGLKYHETQRVCERQASDSGKQQGSTSNGKHVCPDCNKEFSSKKGLLYHQQQKVCLKKSATEPNSDDELLKSLKCSSGASNSCPHCNKTFSSIKGLLYHVKQKVCQDVTDNDDSNNADNVASDVNAPQLSCPHCNKIFASQLGLKYHVDRRVCQKRPEPLDNNESASKRKAEQANSNSSEEEDSTHTPPRRKKKTGNASSSKVPASERTCKKCNQVFGTANGFKYHTEHNVCENRPPDRTKSGGKKKGTRQERTCPHCKKVFTTMLGLNYHVKNKVCQGGSKQSAATMEFNYDTLEAGSKCVTSYGIVQVVADSRQVPAELMLPPGKSVRELMRRRSNNLAKVNQRRKKRFVSLSIKSRLRREKLMRLYDTQKTDHQEEIWNAYFGDNPTNVAEEQRQARKPQVTQPEQEEDPLAPKESYPDRIVECILVPDERRMASDVEDDSDEVSRGADNSDEVENPTPHCGMRLFLKRRQLNQRYRSDAIVYRCVDCAARYTSREGLVYHTQQEGCAKKAKQQKAQRKEHLEVVEEAMQFKLKLDEKARRDDSRKRMKRSAADTGVPSQVMYELGIRDVAPQEPNTTMEKDEDKDYDIGPDLPNPDEVLKELQAELEKAQAILKQPKPGKAKKKKRRKGRRRKKAPPPKKAAPQTYFDKAAPPIIDTIVLVDEVDAGRYPSIQRFHGEHADVCEICKKSVGKLLGCDYCSNVEHLECIRGKLTVKEPEPEEDFMCHKCIQYICDRRNRAEKRRLEKRNNEMDETGNQDNNEYYVVAQKAREVGELMELLKDAQSRLVQAEEVERVNNIRRGLLEEATGTF